MRLLFGLTLAVLLAIRLSGQVEGTEAPENRKPIGPRDLLLLRSVGVDDDALVETVRRRGLDMPRDGRRRALLLSVDLSSDLTTRLLEAGAASANARREKAPGDAAPGRLYHDPALNLSFNRSSFFDWERRDAGGRLRMRGLPEGERAELDYALLDLPRHGLRRKGIEDLRDLFERRVAEITVPAKSWRREALRLVRIGSRYGLSARAVGPASSKDRALVHVLTWVPLDGELLSFVMKIEGPRTENGTPSPREAAVRDLLHTFRRPGETSRPVADLWYLDLEGGLHQLDPTRLDAPAEHPRIGEARYDAIGPGVPGALVTLATGRRLLALPDDRRRLGTDVLQQADTAIREIRGGLMPGLLDLTLAGPDAQRQWQQLDTTVLTDDAPTLRARADLPAGPGPILFGHAGAPWHGRVINGGTLLDLGGDSTASRATTDVVDLDFSPAPTAGQERPGVFVLRRERSEGNDEAKDRVVLGWRPLRGQGWRERWSTRIDRKATGRLRLAVSTDGHEVFALVPDRGLLLFDRGARVPIRLLASEALKDFSPSRH